MQNRVDELEVKLRLADFASRAAKREATEMATRREREAAKARTPPASPLRAPSRASPLKSPPRSPGESLVSLVASTFERESGDAGIAAAAEIETLRARVAMLESDVAARDARVETAESDVRRATRAVRELSARAERRNEERRETAAAETAASAAAAAAARDENVALRRRIDQLETRLASAKSEDASPSPSPSRKKVVSLENELADRDARLAVAESDLRQATSSVADLTARISERDARAREAREARENELVAQLAAADAQMERILEATELKETALRAELDEAKLREARAAARLQAFEETKRSAAVPAGTRTVAEASPATFAEASPIRVAEASPARTPPLAVVASPLAPRRRPRRRRPAGVAGRAHASHREPPVHGDVAVSFQPGVPRGAGVRGAHAAAAAVDVPHGGGGESSD